MSQIRKYFTSRFKNGYLLEFDFSQLEVIALAHLSQDRQLIKDIIDGIDMHRVMAAKLFMKEQSQVTDKERKIAKQLTFQLQYGAGSKSMAKSTKLPENMCKDFINNYYTRYSGVEDWQNKNIQRVVRSRRVVGDAKTPKGNPQGTGYLMSETGRVYTFKEYDSPEWSRTVTSFSPTEIKNYPVQGFATGDIVPMILGKVYRELKAHKEYNNKILLINTVHDSIVFDVKDEYTSDCYDIVKPVMEDTPRYLKEDFDIDFNIPIYVDCKIGRNWLEMEEYDGGY